MVVRHVEGDLFDLGLPALAHGCNCAGSMSGGIAIAFRAKSEQMYDEYRRLCDNGEFRLGGFLRWTLDDGTVVYNLATQQRPGRDARLEAIETSVRAMLADAEQRGIPEVGVPHLGAGIGGLPWPDVRRVLEEVGSESPVMLTIVARRQRLGRAPGRRS
jgi:O-acetyl-ADP-ribose deacetylase (regulator of RNase III)